MQVPGSSNRVAAVWYSATSFTVDVNLADGQTHDLELYFDDWDNRGRSEQVQISDAGTGTVLDTETISSFTNGVYLDWKVSGNLVITITRTAGVNAVLNGLFLDQATATMSVLGGATSVRPGGALIQAASSGVAPALIADSLGAVVDEGPMVGSGASSPGTTGLALQGAAAVDPSIKLAGAGAVGVTMKRPRPDGRVLQAAARRLALQSSAMVQRPGLGSQGQSNQRFGV